jgi:hypothetical protein
LADAKLDRIRASLRESKFRVIVVALEDGQTLLTTNALAARGSRLLIVVKGRTTLVLP